MDQHENIPFMPLSVNPMADAVHHFEVGCALASLRHEGVPVNGSGGFVHNLGELDWGRPETLLPMWA